jgi:hypothetical protein
MNIIIVLIGIRFQGNIKVAKLYKRAQTGGAKYLINIGPRPWLQAADPLNQFVVAPSKFDQRRNYSELVYREFHENGYPPP